ncbi:arrestin domain-containing protein 3-like [Pseudochaenichthys georgianus]|uniref:arrestin domain-containing protein 3-like n=1 Tax=Pseudochaenichthys georgianus TaxID=52239 RepID=UPI00146D350C|nr:arrestin domain-containing protein 3-like [Pseudochaenichthys georgianus]
MTINNFAIEYDAINSRNTFTNGDSINGRIIVEVSKETTVQCLIFIANGKARVRWGDQHHTYWADEKYYDIKHHILRESRQDGNVNSLPGTEVIGKGRHVFPFSFKIPDNKIPSSFISGIGNIHHKLKAELKQSMKLTKKAKTHFTFVSKADMDIPGLLEPQYGSKDKSVTVFGSGIISMDVQTKQMGYKQGRDLKVSVEIVNNSSRSVKAKVILYEKKSFFAQGRRRVSTKEILKEKMEAVTSSNKESVVKVMNIPRELPSSILNCSIIKLEYRLKVHLDVQYASHPEITLPIVILPASEDTPQQQQQQHQQQQQQQQQPSDAGFGFDGFGNPEQAPWSPAPHQPAAAASAMDPPPPYAAYAMYPPNQSWV